jgi:hypothetical protein
MEIIIDTYRGDNQSTSGIVLESYRFDGEKLVSTDPEAVNGFTTVLDRVDRITEMDKTSSVAKGALIPRYYIEYGGQ